ncbi:hypothetical protein Gotur_005398 [Gossypium turneri]
MAPAFPGLTLGMLWERLAVIDIWYCLHCRIRVDCVPKTSGICVCSFDQAYRGISGKRVASKSID